MKHILVVDDNVQVARLVAASLARYDVTVTHNGPEALARASQLPACDLVITDYLMPAMAGDDLAGRVRAMHPKTKTLLVTGFRDLISVAPDTIDACIGKPLLPSVLREAVSNLIGQP